ncbi:hypothetical protein [Ectobacillus panaciterrae]|uniref:hypothetical protein n=1 Tax=Ectobacillus panaciterrae TaxID=363872 RepID=UPI00048E665B
MYQPHSYDTKEEALQHELAVNIGDNSKTLKEIITTGENFAFYITNENRIAIANLKRGNLGKWEVGGSGSGGASLYNLNFQPSGIASSLGSLDNKIIYGYLKNSDIESVSYNSIEGHFINLDGYLKETNINHENLRLWYISIPVGEKFNIKNLNQLGFKDKNGNVIRYETKEYLGYEY